LRSFFFIINEVFVVSSCVENTKIFLFQKVNIIYCFVFFEPSKKVKLTNTLKAMSKLEEFCDSIRKSSREAVEYEVMNTLVTYIRISKTRKLTPEEQEHMTSLVPYIFLEHTEEDND